jgi:surfactin synthase thioesterase subunit
VSAWAPGGHRTGAGEISRLPDADLVAEVRAFGALPEAIASSPAMLAIVLPTLRADFAVYADFTDTGAPAPCPVAAYGGDADPLLLPGAMES